MWHPVLAGLLLALSNVCIHVVGSYICVAWIVHSYRRRPSLNLLLNSWILMRTVLLLLAMHSIEVAIWAEFYIWRRLFPDIETAYYFSLVSYTTLGYGDVVMGRPWRIMAGWEAMIGVLMFGWSTATLVSFVHFVSEARLRKIIPAEWR